MGWAQQGLACCTTGSAGGDEPRRPTGSVGAVQHGVERRRSPRAAFSPACHPLLSPSPLIAFPNRAPAHAPVCARSPKCPVLHAPLPGAALVSDPSSLLRTARVVSPRPFSPRVLLCRVARSLPALPSKPCPPPALHSFCRSSTHPVTPLTPTGYGPQPLPLRLSPPPPSRGHPGTPGHSTARLPSFALPPRATARKSRLQKAPRQSRLAPPKKKHAHFPPFSTTRCPTPTRLPPSRSTRYSALPPVPIPQFGRANPRAPPATPAPQLTPAQPAASGAASSSIQQPACPLASACQRAI